MKTKIFVILGLFVALSSAQIDLQRSGIIQQYAADSCLSLLQMGVATSGVYWLKSPVGTPFQGYCDMKSFGGGWLICYTSSNTVNMGVESFYNASFPSPPIDGYRTDCRHYGFNEVMYFDHTNDQKMFFQREPSPFNCNEEFAAAIKNNTRQLWTAMTTPYEYQNQLVVCEKGLGFFVSGYTNNCWKNCNDWCDDRTSKYYRHAAAVTADQSAAGVAFKINGFNPILANPTTSVGIRYRTQANHDACQA